MGSGEIVNGYPTTCTIRSWPFKPANLGRAWKLEAAFRGPSRTAASAKLREMPQLREQRTFPCATFSHRAANASNWTWNPTESTPSPRKVLQCIAGRVSVARITRVCDVGHRWEKQQALNGDDRIWLRCKTGLYCTVTVNDCVAAVPIPLDAVKVRVEVPATVGVPLSVAVPFPLSTNFTPFGRVPFWVMLAVG